MTRRGSWIVPVSVLAGSLFVAPSAKSESVSEPGQAARRRTIVSASSGLVGFGAGKLVRLSLVDVAERARPWPALLRVVDSRNEVLAEVKGNVSPGKPLTLELRRDDVPRSESLQIRGMAKLPRGRQRRNVLNFTMEVLDPDDGECECQLHCPGLCDTCFPPPGERGQFDRGDCSITFSDTFASP